MYKKKILGLQKYKRCRNILVLQFLAYNSSFWYDQNFRIPSFRCQTCPETHHYVMACSGLPSMVG
jgi:hypothetical protein